MHNVIASLKRRIAMALWEIMATRTKFTLLNKFITNHITNHVRQTVHYSCYSLPLRTYYILCRCIQYLCRCYNMFGMPSAILTECVNRVYHFVCFVLYLINAQSCFITRYKIVWPIDNCSLQSTPSRLIFEGFII